MHTLLASFKFANAIKTNYLGKNPRNLFKAKNRPKKRENTKMKTEKTGLSKNPKTIETFFVVLVGNLGFCGWRGGCRGGEQRAGG